MDGEEAGGAEADVGGEDGPAINDEGADVGGVEAADFVGMADEFAGGIEGVVGGGLSTTEHGLGALYGETAEAKAVLPACS
jgi:hypothetical protein